MPDPVDPVEQQRRYDRYVAFKDHVFDTNKGATDLGIMALRTVILINGAASIALLAFAGQIAGRLQLTQGDVQGVFDVLRYLVSGAFLGALASGFGYLRYYFESVYLNAATMKEGAGMGWARATNISVLVAIALVIASYILFVLGMLEAATALPPIIKAPPTVGPIVGK